MKTVLFLLTSFLPVLAFAQSIATGEKFNCRLNEANLVECEENSPSYYFQNKIVEDTEERKVEIRLLINRGVLIPALEESLAVTVHSLQAKDLTKSASSSGQDFTFFLNMAISSESIPPLNVTCSAVLYNGSYRNFLKVENCTEERELLTFDQGTILLIENKKSIGYGWNKKLVPQLDYYRPIMRIMQITRKRGPCQSKVFFTKEGCPGYEEEDVSKTTAGIYQEK